MILGGIVYLHDISVLRFPGTARRNLEVFKRLCGDAAFDKVLLCTTQRGQGSFCDGVEREAEMKTLHWKEMVDKGSQVGRFEGDQQSAWEMVSIFLQRASQRREELRGGLALQIQDEMTAKAKNTPLKIRPKDGGGAGDRILKDGKETDIVIPFAMPSHMLLGPR